MSWNTDTDNNTSKADSPVEHGGLWKADDEFQCGDFSAANTSKHAGGDYDGPADGGCRICHEDSHFARDCPKSEGCFNCGEHGHMKAECPQKQSGVCKVCNQEGHVGTECSANRLLAPLSNLRTDTLSESEAWELVEKADQDKEVEDIKKAILEYALAFPDLTFEALEKTFREANMSTFLIAKQQDILPTHTIVNLQGAAELKYVVSIQFSAKPRRAKFAEGWPTTPEDNMSRLQEAGFVMDNLIPRCRNCDEMGHISRDCEQDKQEPAKIAITCANCNEEGHRARDCTQERKSANKGCRNCGMEGHMAKDCAEPRSAENVECKNCQQLGHFSRDCPTREPDLCRNCGQEGHRAKDCMEERVMKCRNCDAYGHAARECPEPKNMSKIQCRNCDEFGHTGRECPKPTDWTRVECSNCHEKGHTYKRCKNPAAEVEIEGGDGGWGAPTTNESGAWAKSDFAANGGW